MIYKAHYVSSRLPALDQLALAFLACLTRLPRALSLYRNILMSLVRTPWYYNHLVWSVTADMGCQEPLHSWYW